MTDQVSGAVSPKAFHHKSYRLFWCASMSASFSAQIMSVSVGWQIYALTSNPLLLGLVGLAQFLPVLLLVLVTGMAADRFPRRVIMGICLGVEALCALSLFSLVSAEAHEVWPIFATLVVLGIARAFLAPASASLVPNIVPPEALSNALGLNGSAWQLANIVGPMTGGLLYGVAGHFGFVHIAPGSVAYATAFILSLCGMSLVFLIPKPPMRSSNKATSVESLLAGFRYIWSEKVVLGAISLDMFAVLLGGAVALLPIYAADILQTGPWGLGLLRAAPGVGAICMVIILNRFPVRDHAGRILFIFVALFGMATSVFGLSTTVWMAVPALFFMGAFDMVSVIIRETLLQLWTPDEVRGRVSAVNSVFLGASNELGEFRAGVVAAMIGAVGAVTLGGVGTMAVAGIWSRFFPGLRQARKLDKRMV